MSHFLSGRPGVPEEWRDAERDVFEVMVRMEKGEMPSVVGRSPEDIVRMGYAAAYLLVFCRAPDELATLVEVARPFVKQVQGVPLVPGSSMGDYTKDDELASEWHITTGLDYSRYRSEAPVIRLMLAEQEEMSFAPPTQA